jgi:nodulation protein A
VNDDIRWEVVPESALTLPDHEAIAAMLGQAFPDWSHWYVGGRSWSGMEPEVRVVARDADDVVVAHLGIRRQFVTAAGRDLLVGVVGLVAVSPSQQGTGLGGELLRRTAAVLEGMRVPFGLLGTGEHTRPFYAHHGWALLEPTVMTYSAFTAEGAGLSMTDDDGWMVLPVASTMEDWPGGPVWWNAQQV